MSKGEIVTQIPKLKTPRMRFEKIENSDRILIQRRSLNSLQNIETKGKKIAVLASMKNFGGFFKTSHREVGELADEIIDKLFSFGEAAKELF